MDLVKFISLVEQSLALQEKISQCSSKRILEILIEEYKCEFTIDDLEKRSSDLAASYWPWANKDRSFRKAYFDKK